MGANPRFKTISQKKSDPAPKKEAQDGFDLLKFISGAQHYDPRSMLEAVLPAAPAEKQRPPARTWISPETAQTLHLNKVFPSVPNPLPAVAAADLPGGPALPEGPKAVSLPFDTMTRNPALDLLTGNTAKASPLLGQTDLGTPAVPQLPINVDSASTMAAPPPAPKAMLPAPATLSKVPESDRDLQATIARMNALLPGYKGNVPPEVQNQMNRLVFAATLTPQERAQKNREVEYANQKAKNFTEAANAARAVLNDSNNPEVAKLKADYANGVTTQPDGTIVHNNGMRVSGGVLTAPDGTVVGKVGPVAGAHQINGLDAGEFFQRAANAQGANKFASPEPGYQGVPLDPKSYMAQALSLLKNKKDEEDDA